MITKVLAAVFYLAATAAVTTNAQAQRIFDSGRGARPTTLVATNIATGVVATNPATSYQPVGDSAQIAVQLILNGLGAGATNSCAVLTQESCDGVNWVNGTTLQLTGSGATTVSCISNITLGARGYWRWRTITSTANGTGTNLAPTLILNRKPGF
jgi:hypothetical protein